MVLVSLYHKIILIKNSLSNNMTTTTILLTHRKNHQHPTAKFNEKLTSKLSQNHADKFSACCLQIQ